MSIKDILDFIINTFRYYLTCHITLDLTINSVDLTRTRSNYGFPQSHLQPNHKMTPFCYHTFGRTPKAQKSEPKA